MAEANTTENSVVISDDVASLPSGDDILRSFRKRATINLAKLLVAGVVLVSLARLVAFWRTQDSIYLIGAATWVAVASLFAVGQVLAGRGRLEQGAYSVLAGIVLIVGITSLLEGPVFALVALCLGYPLLYVSMMGLAPPEHFRWWTLAMPIAFAVNVVARQVLNPIELLTDPLDLLTVAGCGALGMILVGRLAVGLLRALRRSLALSEAVRLGLERTQRQLVAHRHALEERVRERTHDLEVKNASLAETLESLQRTQEQLVQSEKMASLGLLVAGIAHEIKNPLNFVNNFAELAVEFIDEIEPAARESSPEEVRTTLSEVSANLAKIREHGLRADGIINAMLMHARDRRGEPVSVAFNAMVIEHAVLAYQGFRARYRTFTLDLVKDIDAGIEEVLVPYQEVARVVVNLVSNACHAMHERQRHGVAGYRPILQLSTSRRPGEVSFTVRDNGIGITADVRRRLFDPFFTTKPPGEGTGLGLSLSYEIIVKELGGAIEVESMAGEGATFKVRVPIADGVERTS